MMTARWPVYTATLVLGTLIAFLAMMAFVAVVDPWKALPRSASLERPVLFHKQRLLYPMLIRSGRFDSFMFGSSTGMLLDPASFKTEGRFLNTALTNGLAWEQLELLHLILSEVPQPRVLMFTIDWVWCVRDLRRDNERQFPHWIYSGLSWRNLLKLLNGEAFKDAWQTLEHNWVRPQPSLRGDGYWLFTPDDDTYDLDAAVKKIYDSGKSPLLAPIVPPQAVPDAEKAWAFPYLDKLEEALARTPATRKLFVTMPVHVIAQPRPGSIEAQREAACKQRIARIAAKHGSVLIDFRISSAVTRADSNYWDSLHYRVPIARRTEASILVAARSQQPDPAGFWQILDAR
jgi:hypothetical protein